MSTSTTTSSSDAATGSSTSSHRDRVRVTALAHHLGLEKSTMTGLVDRAVRRGLLSRAPDPGDGRAVDVFLSADGLDLADRLHTAGARLLGGLTAGLGVNEQHRLAALLGRVVRSASVTGTETTRPT